MAVHCGVCAVRLGGAWENGGSFQVGTNFKNGWELNEKPIDGKSVYYRIDNTCEDCAHVLRVAIAERASRIATDNQERILVLRAACEAACEAVRKAEAESKAERAAFEAAWVAHRNKR